MVASKPFAWGTFSLNVPLYYLRGKRPSFTLIGNLGANWNFSNHSTVEVTRASSTGEVGNAFLRMRQRILEAILNHCTKHFFQNSILVTFWRFLISLFLFIHLLTLMLIFTFCKFAPCIINNLYCSFWISKPGSKPNVYKIGPSINSSNYFNKILIVSNSLKYSNQLRKNIVKFIPVKDLIKAYFSLVSFFPRQP
jgi:hypothetical protein